jgi:Questin oxidase-like
MSDNGLVEELLNDKSHHIEFNGHLTNHVKHAVVALAGLGAPPHRIKEYYDDYAELTSYGYGLEPARAPRNVVTEENWTDFLGQRTDWAGLCDFFDRREKELGMPELLRQYMPTLLPGWVGAFTHATIHLGWALDIGNRWMAIEGLAYLTFTHVSCHPERTSTAGHHAGETALDSLLRVAGVWEEDHDALQQWVRSVLDDTGSPAAAALHPELSRSGLQYRIARMLGEGHPLIYDTPAWVEEQDPATSWEQLYYVVTLLYLSEPGDFVLLHLVTSLHAMEQIAERLPAEARKDVVRNFWTGILCVVFSGADFPSRRKLAALHAAFGNAVDAPGNPAWEQEWGFTVARAMEEAEEHNPKLVYVLRKVWERTGNRSVYRVAAAQFTATPELPPSFEEPPTE